MSEVKELIKTEANGSISFGNHTLETKTKVEDFKIGGNLYKVKTFKDLTKLERDGMLVYESEPGTSVNNFVVKEDGLSFTVCGPNDAMITVDLSEDTEYDVTVDGKNIGRIKTNLAGKLSFSAQLADKGEVAVVIQK